jgi:hypothetical protein
MADDTIVATDAPTAPDLSQVQITLEQICAAIIAQNGGPVSVPTAVLLQDYSKYSIQITHDDENNTILFELAELPVEEVTVTEATE